MSSNGKYITYKTEKTKSNYRENSKIGKGSKMDTYKKWERDGVLNDKLLIIEGMARDGATVKQIAEGLGISYPCLLNMRDDYKDIYNAIKKGKEVVDYAVENALLKKALGGDTTAMMFWLKNRKPAQWRDLKEVNAHIQEGLVNIDLSGIVGRINEKNHLELEDENKSKH